MGTVIDRPRLKIRLVLDRTRETRIVHIDQRRHQLTRAFLEGVKPLALPGAVQLFRQPVQRLGHQLASVVGLDADSVADQIGLQLGELVRGQIGLTPNQVLLQLHHPTLGTVQHLLRQRRRLDASGRVTQVLAQQGRLGHQRLAHHVAGGETVH